MRTFTTGSAVQKPGNSIKGGVEFHMSHLNFILQWEKRAPKLSDKKGKDSARLRISSLYMLFVNVLCV